MSSVSLLTPPAHRVWVAVSDTLDVAGRNLRNLIRTPQTLVFATIQPVMFVLLFRYAFGGAIRVPGIPYVDYLMPGIFAQSVAFGAVGTAVGLSDDLRSGLLERFRTLPMARIAVLAGRTSADLARNMVVVAIMTGVGFAVGFRVHTGAAGVLAALVGVRQPVTALVNAERALLLGGPAADHVLASIAWSVGLLAAFALLATRTYQRMSR